MVAGHSGRKREGVSDIEMERKRESLAFREDLVSSALIFQPACP